MMKELKSELIEKGGRRRTDSDQEGDGLNKGNKWEQWSEVGMREGGDSEKDEVKWRV
jgi:hypothetical protein